MYVCATFNSHLNERRKLCRAPVGDFRPQAVVKDCHRHLRNLALTKNSVKKVITGRTNKKRPSWQPCQDDKKKNEGGVNGNTAARRGASQPHKIKKQTRNETKTAQGHTDCVEMCGMYLAWKIIHTPCGYVCQQQQPIWIIRFRLRVAESTG